MKSFILKLIENILSKYYNLQTCYPLIDKVKWIYMPVACKSEKHGDYLGKSIIYFPPFQTSELASKEMERLKKEWVPLGYAISIDRIKLRD